MMELAPPQPRETPWNAPRPAPAPSASRTPPLVTAPADPVPDPVTVYTTSWCGYCIRLKHSLGRAGVAYTEVDIETDPGAAALVERVNGGNQTVPTVVLPDGTAMTNPSVRDIVGALGT